MTSTISSRTGRNDRQTISMPLGLKISGNTPIRQQMEKRGLRFHRLLIQAAGPVWRVLPLTVQRMVLRCALPKVSLGVCAVVEDAAGRLLVVRHSYRQQPWGLPGGFVRRGEEPAAALLREIREELGVEATLGPLLFAERNDLNRHLTLYYRAYVRGTFRLGSGELDGYLYLPADELTLLFPAMPPTWVRGITTRGAA